MINEKELETVKRLLDAEKLDAQIEMVIKANKSCNNNRDSVMYNKKLNLPLDSKIGVLMAIAKTIEL